MIKTLLNLPWIAKIINHQLGGFVVTGVAWLVGELGIAAAHFHLQLSAETTAWLSNNLTKVCIGLAAGAVQYYQSGSAKQLQTALGLEQQDGWIGPQTIATAQQVRKATLATPAELAAAEAPGDPLKVLNFPGSH